MTSLDASLTALLDTVPAPADADIRAERVPYGHDGTALDGFLAWDAGADGPRPAVLILHDWNGEGEYVRVRAQMLARLGYVAFAADVYGAGVRPEGDDAATTAQSFYRDLPLMRARVAAGYDVLRDDARVDPTRIAVIGYCFGGSAALEFARTGAQVRGTVSFHGSLITHAPADVARVASPLLVLTGGSDPVVPDSAVIAFQDELRTRDDLDWQVVTYSGAPHAFTRPGSPAYRPVADARSWAAMRAFLDEVMA
ncbi:dienelactone hydrolase family protein [Humibacter sp. BT305]|nr:dienelactone hydrolase family protein [Humibacter sp. BT305]